MSKLTMEEVRAQRDPTGEAAMRVIAKRIREQWKERWEVWEHYTVPSGRYTKPVVWPELFGEPGGTGYCYWKPKPRSTGDICMWTTQSAPDGKFWACVWRYRKTGKHAGSHVMVKSSFKVFKRRKDAKAYSLEMHSGKG